MERPDSERDAIAIAFLKKFLDDRTRERARGLEEYQALFPGYEELIAEEFAKASESVDPAADAIAEPGMKIGHYRILRSIGRGGQADVFLAEDETLGRMVAVKVLRRWVGAPQTVLRRFRREAALASRLDHPSICTIYDVGLDDGVPYIVMRYIEGSTLGRLIPTTASRGDTKPDDEPPSTSRVGREAVDRFARLLEETARAVHLAHEENVLHRDLKPSNILVTRDDTPVVLDFGLARSLDHAADASFTQTGDLFGTPAYMSPEQLAAHRVPLDARTDVYSLGVTLYECLTSRRPFEAPTREGLYQAILTKAPTACRKRNPAIPRDLETIVETAIAKDRDHRYQTALDFADDLARWRSGKPVRARAVGPIGRLVRWARREPARAGLVAACLAIATVIGYGLAMWPQIEADRQFAESRRQADALERHVVAGFDAIARHEPEEGVPEFDAALAIAPTSREAIVGRTLAEGYTGAWVDALATLERLEAATEQRFDRVRCELLIDAGRGEEARLIETGLDPPNDHVDWFVAAIVEQSRMVGHDDHALAQRAIHNIERAILLAPTPRELYARVLAECAGRSNDRAAAEHAATALGHFGLDTPRERYLHAFVTAVFDPERAIELLRELIADEESVESLGTLARLLDARGDYEESIALYERAREIAPRRADIVNNLAGSLLNAGRTDDAIDAMLAFRKLAPGDLRWHQRLGAELSKLDRFDEVIELCEEAVKYQPKNANNHANLALTLHRVGRLDDSIKATRRAIDLSPSDPTLHRRLGSFLTDAKRFDEAVAALKENLRLDPDDHLGRYALGRVLVKRGDHSEALTVLEAIPHAQRTWGSWSELGAAYNGLRRFEEAETAYRASIAHVETATALYNLGAALCGQFRFREAAATMRRSIAVRGKPWPKGATVFVQSVEKMAQGEGDAEAVVRGTSEAISFERLVNACTAVAKKRDAKSATIVWRELLHRFPAATLNRTPSARLRLASAAITASTTAESEAEATEFRTLALEHLRAQLDDYRDAHRSGTFDDAELRRRAKQLRNVRQYTPVRSPDALEDLPGDEADAWRAFWADVVEVARTKTP